MSETARSRALDAWDYARPFARFHIRWGPPEGAPAFPEDQALAIVIHELKLAGRLTVWAQRLVLVTFSSEHIALTGRSAESEPAWVVILAGQKQADAPPDGPDPLPGIEPGAGVVVQALLHAHSGELLLGTALPVTMRPHLA